MDSHLVLITQTNTGKDILVGDYGQVVWLDDDDVEVARSGGGGYGDFNDGRVRSISRIEVVYPPLEINSFDSGDDDICK